MAKATKITVEQRLAALEAEVALLKEQLTRTEKPAEDWLDTVYGAFADDPSFEEATRLGREWRESFRPKPRKKGKKTHARSGHGSSNDTGKHK